MSATAPARHIALYSGTRLDLIAPRAETIFLCDIAEILARTETGFADSGPYSLAQRAVILAEHIGRAEGAHAACYALMGSAGIALLRSVEPFDLCREGHGGLCRSYDQLMAAAHEAVDMDWPPAPAIARALRVFDDSLRLRELMTLSHNVEPEIMRLRDAGVTALGAHLAPVSRDRAWNKWIGTWKVMAHAAGLSVTPAWRGLSI